jgi:TM2 domain-containing membrane protein YozV
MSQATNAATAAPLSPDHHACSACGAQILRIAEICPKCGVRQKGQLSKAALLLITFFLGGIGGHKFYTGRWVQGVLYFLFFWTLIPSIVALIEFIVYASTDSARLNEKYTAHNTAVIVVVVAGFGGIFVLGVLAAIAIPAYQDYVMRARVASSAVLAAPWRVAVEEHFIDKGRLPGSTAELSQPVRPQSDKYGSIGMEKDGLLVVTFAPHAGRLAGKTIHYRPSAAGQRLSWDCTGGSLEPKYRPAACRAPR